MTEEEEEEKEERKKYPMQKQNRMHPLFAVWGCVSAYNQFNKITFIGVLFK